MSEWLYTLNPVIQALVAGLFTWAVTATGAAVVVFTRQMSRALLDAMLGFAAGVMMAASCWSLLVPAIDMATRAEKVEFSRATIGVADLVERCESADGLGCLEVDEGWVGSPGAVGVLRRC